MYNKMKDRKIRISIVVLNYNGLKYNVLQKCLKSIKNQKKVYETIIVDNGSRDRSVKFIKEKYAKFKVIKNKKNIGFSEAFNKGVYSAKGDYIVTLSNDVTLDKEFIKNLLQEIKKDKQKFGMYAPKILYQDKPTIINSTGLLIFKDGSSKLRGVNENDRNKYNKGEEVFCPAGAAGIFKKELIKKIGFYDKDFIAYNEDHDLGWRARLNGWKCKFSPILRVYHKRHTTKEGFTKKILFLSERNRILGLIKNFRIRDIILSQFYFLKKMILINKAKTKDSVRTKYLKKHSMLKILWYFLLGDVNALILFPKFMIKRIGVQKLKKISDKEIKRWFRKFSEPMEKVVHK